MRKPSQIHRMLLTKFWSAPAKLCVSVFLLAPASAMATEHEAGIWNILSTTNSFPRDAGDSRWSYALDIQARYPSLGTGANQQLIRPSVGYRVGENLQVWLGYARTRARNSAGFVADENRLFQQANWTAGQFKGGTFTMRARLLQRDVSVGDDVGLVLRLMTKYTRPIGDDGVATLILGLEPFFDLRDTDWSGDTGLSQNRTYAGVGWRLSDKLALETGYMNQYIFRDGREDVSNHIAVLNFKVKF